MREFLLELLVQYGRGRIAPQFMIAAMVGNRSGNNDLYEKARAALADKYIGRRYPAQGYYLTDKALEFINEGSTATLAGTERD